MGKRMIMTLRLTAFLALASCATAAQNRSAEIRATHTRANEEIKACEAPVFSDPAYQSLRAHIGMPGAPTLGQLADTTLISDADKPVYLAFRSRLQPCATMDVERYVKIDLAMGVIEQTTVTDGNSIRVRLVQRKISWGEMLTQLAQVNAFHREELIARANVVDGQLARQNRAEINQRAAAAAAFSAVANQMNQQAQQQQIINQMNRPVTTNRNRFGNTTNCTTY